MLGRKIQDLMIPLNVYWKNNAKVKKQKQKYLKWYLMQEDSPLEKGKQDKRRAHLA